MILKMVDEVLEKRALASQLSTEAFPPLSEKFERSLFFEKLEDPQMKGTELFSILNSLNHFIITYTIFCFFAFVCAVGIPTQYQAARQKAIWPTHSSEKRKRIMDIKARLNRNDGGLVRLRLGSEGIDDSLLKMITGALPENIYLQHIMLQDNAITDAGLEALCQGLKYHPSIHTLWVGGNQISDHGARSVAELILQNPNIKDVNISNRWPRRTWSEEDQITHPCITATGAAMFARQLEAGSNLLSLNLAEQRVCDPGAIQIFHSLKKSKLRSLNLKANRLTDKCTKALKEALQNEPILEKLVLACNGIKDAGVSRIVSGLG